MDLENIDWLLAAGLLVGYVLVDGMYAIYTIYVVKRRAILAATNSFIMHFVLAAGVLSYTKNAFYILPIAIGSFVGTFLATKYTPK